MACYRDSFTFFLLFTDVQHMGDKAGYTLELYSVTQVQQFSTAISEAPDDDHDHVVRNM
jgi:hypothetical protein